MKKEKVVDYCGGCIFDSHYCFESFSNLVTSDMKNCGFNRKNRDTNPLWLKVIVPLRKKEKP